MKHRNVGLLAALATLALVWWTASALAGIVYFPGTGHWYEAVKVPAGLTWNEAVTNATRRGGYLCTIANSNENAFAASLVDISYYSDVSVNHDILGPWLGALRHANQSNWQWLTGEPFTYSNWYPGQPDGYGGSEQRLQFYHFSTIGSTWGDHPGDPIPGFTLPRGYIVEYDKPPVLTATRSNDVITVSWPLPFAAWTLETTPELPGSSNTWSTVASSEMNSNATSVFINVTNPVSNAFFRLRW